MTKHIFPKEKRLTMAAIFLFIGLISLPSCKKTESDLGLNVLPESDQLNMEVDTIEIDTYSFIEDSIPSDEFSVNLIGSYMDSEFGLIKTSFYSQVTLATPASTADFGTTPIVDSVVLSLHLKDHYGNQNDQTFKVFQITQDIFKDSSYYTNSVIPNNAIDLVKSGFETFTPSMTADPIIDGDTLEPQIRIRLNETLGNDFINSGMLTDETTFQNYFKGLFVTVNSATSGGGVYSVDLEDDETRLTIYYHNTVDTLKYEMLISDDCARFTHTEHDYTGTKVAQQLADSTLGNEFYYLQAGGGLVANISFPTLLNLTSNGRIIVNRAQLYLPVQHYSIDPLAPTSRVIAYGLDDEGEIFTMPDFNLGTAIYGGVYNEEKKAFEINMIRYLQDVINEGAPLRPIRLASTASAVSVNRTILSGKNSPNREKPYLIVYYTKYN